MKLIDKKKKVASKMKGDQQSGGEHGNTREGDSAPHYKPQDRFSKKDVNKEKKARAEKHGSEPKSDWED